MKHFKLRAWPDLPPTFHRTAFKRMLHQMSQRYVSVPHLMQESGLARAEVLHFLGMLAERDLLREREQGAPDSVFGNLRAIEWLRRTFIAEERA